MSGGNAGLMRTDAGGARPRSADPWGRGDLTSPAGGEMMSYANIRIGRTGP